MYPWRQPTRRRRRCDACTNGGASLSETTLTHIPFDPDVPALLKKLRIEGKPGFEARCTRLAREAVRLARPKAAYRLASVEAEGEGIVVVDGVTLTSRVLRANLADVHRVFPFVATCGTELADWAGSIDDMLEAFWADTIMEEALEAALDAVTEHMVRRYDLAQTSEMNPGSLPDWPIEQQANLFRILGEVSAEIGVELTDSSLMIPMKSVSGLRFPSEVRFENCQLCPREGCPNRRVPYGGDPTVELGITSA
jgi:hypothetical protein